MFNELLTARKSFVLSYICATLQLMKLKFYKYQGTGNDFILIDNRGTKFSKNNTKIISNLCDRKFGIGGDGLILLEEADRAEDDFKMVYYNADGNESSMCGNGGRCLTAFAKFLGIIEDSANFMAIDGHHEAKIKDHLVSLKLQDVSTIEEYKDHIYLNTGSPHHIIFSEEIDNLDVKAKGSKVRFSVPYAEKGGTNVNFVQQVNKNEFKVRTYERGVEDETLSCGTGVTAVAIAVNFSGKTNSETIKLITPGGELIVSFEKNKEMYKNVWLTGPATFVFEGEIIC